MGSSSSIQQFESFKRPINRFPSVILVAWQGTGLAPYRTNPFTQDSQCCYRPQGAAAREQLANDFVPRLNTGLCSVLNTIEKSAETVIAETPHYVVQPQVAKDLDRSQCFPGLITRLLRSLIWSLTWSGLRPGGTQVYSSRAHPESSSECECRWLMSPPGAAWPPPPGTRASSLTSPDIPLVTSDSVFLKK